MAPGPINALPSDSTSVPIVLVVLGVLACIAISIALGIRYSCLRALASRSTATDEHIELASATLSTPRTFEPRIVTTESTINLADHESYDYRFLEYSLPSPPVDSRAKVDGRHDMLRLSVSANSQTH